MRLALIALAAGFTLLHGLPARAERQVQAAGADRPIVIGTSHSLASAHLGDVRQVNVWVPSGHGVEGRRFRVLYVLDGGTAQDFQHIAGLAQLGDLSWTFEPIIVVGVETRDRRADLTPPPTDSRFVSAFPSAGGAEAFRRFFAEEVIPFVEARYQASGQRALAGESLAGLFVIDTLLKAPDLFDDYFAISPSLWWDDQRLAHEAGALLHTRGVAGRRLWLAVADEGGTMQEGVDRLRLALANTTGSPVLIYSDRSATETHATIYHGAMLDGLRTFYGTPDEGSSEPPWYMVRNGVPPKSGY